MKMKPPRKPFPEFKWRWATVTCTEGLNDPLVFFGVLRALRLNEGVYPSNPDFLQSLKIIEKHTKTDVHLARSNSRNIIRNSGQYWKAFNLLVDTRGGIKLSDFGRKVADGLITKTEFASTIIKTFEIPNRFIELNIRKWNECGIKIKPLELILGVLSKLEEYGIDNAYITPFELTKIVIPLSAESSDIDKHSHAIILYRKNRLDISEWPDCAPGANDKRIAREFLLFLNHYGFCKVKRTTTRDEEQYFLNYLEASDIQTLIDLPVSCDIFDTMNHIRETEIPSISERRKVVAEIIARPQQSQFRKNVLKAFNSRCLITEVELPDVLEAAHIIPVKHNGSDSISNSVCLRSDIHQLFDSGHLRIDNFGKLHLSETAIKKQNYGSLPSKINIPSFIDGKAIMWRWSYL